MVARHARLPALRGALLLTGCAAAVLATWSLAVPPLSAVARPVAEHGPAALADVAFAEALTGGCAAVLLGCALWLLGTAGLVVISHLARLLAPGSATPATLCRLAERCCPAVTRSVVTATLGVAVSAGASAVPRWPTPPAAPSSRRAPPL